MPTTIINTLPALECIYRLCFTRNPTLNGVTVTLPVAPEFLIRGLLGLSASEVADTVRVLVAGGDVVQSRETSFPCWLPNPVKLALSDGRALFARIDDFNGTLGVRVAVGTLKGNAMHDAIEFHHLHADGIPCFKLTPAGIQRVRGESLQSAPATAKAETDTMPQLVTLTQIVTLLKKSKKWLENHKHELGDPAIPHRNSGKADYYDWTVVRPALVKLTGNDRLPERYPGSMP